MQLYNESKTVKQYFGVTNKQTYHTPVMYREKSFYLIKIQKVTDINRSIRQPSYYQSQQPTLPTKPIIGKSTSQTRRVKPPKFQVIMQVGSRSSSQTIQFQLNYHSKKNQSDDNNLKGNAKQFSIQQLKILQMLKQSQKFTDLHIFPFQRQQIMTIMFKNCNDEQEYGYALMPLVPFLKMPMMRHQIEVELVFQNQRKQIRNELAAVVHLSLYYLYNFHGHLLIQPMQATLTRNLAQIGQMSPIIRMYLRDKEFNTQRILQGGINPNWQSSNRYCYFNIPIESALDELYIYLFYNREVTMDEMIGWYKIDLQNEGLFKWGESLKSLIQQQAKNRKKQKLDDTNWLMKQRQQVSNKLSSQLSNKSKKNSKLNKQLDNVNKTQKLIILSQQKRKQMQHYQLMWISSQVDKVRQELIQFIIQNVYTLTSEQVPDRVLEIMENIYQLYIDKEKYIFEEFEKKCHIDLSEFTGEDLEEIKRRSVTTLKWEKVREEVKKMLMREVNGLMKFFEDKMEEIKVPIMYIPVNLQGEEQQPIEVGMLTLKYLFLYDFEIPKEDKDEVQNKKQQQSFGQQISNQQQIETIFNPFQTLF